MTTPLFPREARRWQLALLLYFIGFGLLMLLAYRGGLYGYRWIYKLNPYGRFDVLAHFWIYGFGGYLLHRALGERHLFYKEHAFPWGFLLFAIFAVIEEGLQGLSPRRSMSAEDLFANFSGLAFFYLLSLRANQRAVHSRSSS